MKICDLVQSYTHTGGGIKTYINEKIKYVTDHTNFEHVLIIPGEKDSCTVDGRRTVYQISSPFIPGCEPYRITLSLDKVVTILKQEQPSVIELGSAYTFPWAAFKYRKQYQCPIVGFCHTDFPTAYVEPWVNSVLGKVSALTAKAISSKYAKLVYNKCNVTIAPSKVFQNNLQRYGVKSVKHIPLGVDTEIFNPQNRDNTVRENLGIKKDDLFLIYAGRLDVEKRVSFLVEAFNKLPNNISAMLVLIGDGPLKDSIQSSGNGKIIVLPYVTDKPELARILDSADIYVTAGPFETFGLSVLEAQASGLPVVGVKAGALIERVPQSVGLLGDKDSPEEMTANIVQLAQGNYKNMGYHARKMVESEFTWTRTFENILQLYSTL